MAEQGEGYTDACKGAVKRKRPQPQNLHQPRRSIRLLEISQRTDSIPLMPRKPNKKSTKSSAQSLFYPGENNNEKRGYESPDDKKIMAINISMPLLGGTSSDGWSEEQDLALHNAYYTLKVSATFWKDVAKLVPGKSSKECFDRFYSAYPTPRFSRSKSKLDGKIRRTPKRPLNLHSLLKATGSTGRRFHYNRQKILQAHRTVRWLLGKYKTADKGYETDLFSSVGVESADSSIQTSLLLTGKPISPDIFLKSVGNSSQTESPDGRISLPGLKQQIFSPEVLKQIKNPAQHEKFIDLLHFREAAKTKIPNKYIVKEIPELLQREAIYAAKAALAAETQQLLIQSQSSGLGESDDDRSEEEYEDYADDDETINYTSQ